MEHPIRALREAHGVQQGQMAAEVGVSQAHLCNIELGNIQPSDKVLRDCYSFLLALDGIRVDLSEKKKPVDFNEQLLVEAWRDHDIKMLRRMVSWMEDVAEAERQT